MDESSWSTATDWKELLRAVSTPLNQRKARLWVVAICWQTPYELRDVKVLESLSVIERYADGTATSEELEAAVGDASYVSYESMYNDPFAGLAYSTDDARLFTSPVEWVDYLVDPLVVDHGVPAAQLVRDIFGNPFRPVSFSPGWRTDTAMSLARQMYESRDFSLMPILADALQDAGCEDEDILAHCRDPQGTHVRGCWVVDLVLGKA